MAQAKQQIPRAMIHKQILDAASANPDASLEELARDVSGASVGLVERVLDQYGDPTAPEDPPQDSRTDTSETQPMHDQEPLPDADEITEEQRVVLEAVRRWPDATQAELARQVGVSASTVNRRLHKIDGFQWTDRHRYARELIPSDSGTPTTGVASDGGPTGATGTLADPESNGTDPGTDSRNRTDSGSVSAPDSDPDTDSELRSGPEPADSDTGPEAESTGIEARLDRLERQLQQAPPAGAGTIPFEDPGLAAKVIRACMASDTISEEEELRVIEAVITVSDRE